MEEKDITGESKTVKKKDIVRNYQDLVRELFDRSSKIEWSSSYDNKRQVFTSRVKNEVPPNH